jgi:hypothetical protein
LAYSEEYLINVQGEQKGPYTFPQLKRLYDTNLIPQETLYWQDGMEQWQAVSDLCGASQRDRLRRLRQLRVTGIVLVAVVALMTAYCAPVLKDLWRELNDPEWTQEGAYWRARGFVREEVKTHDQSVAFEPYLSATVTLTGTEAAVVLPGTLFGKDGTRTTMTWKVAIRYDVEKKEWTLPGKAGGD